jgi:two-component system chemotaxis response regulator CheV
MTDTPTESTATPSGPLSTPGDILLDAGTNEVEVLVFRLGDGWYGVNVAKVREVLLPVEVTRSPGRHESVDGVFNCRGVVTPVVCLRRFLEMKQDGDEESRGRLIITEFNGLNTAFMVDGVDQIHRMSWSKVKPAPEFRKDETGMCTGIIDLDGRLILMLDFESVADAINLEEKLHIECVENTFGVDRASKRVVLAEDSPFMRTRMRRALTTSGYDRLEVYADGLDAWQAIDTSDEPLDAIVADIEMPRMDGLHLCKRVKGDPRFKDVPLVLFSSLITQDNLKKGRQVGADAQVAKPEMHGLIHLVDRMIAGIEIEESEIVNYGRSRLAA